jgi:hypothetical protein
MSVLQADKRNHYLTDQKSALYDLEFSVLDGIIDSAALSNRGEPIIVLGDSIVWIGGENPSKGATEPIIRSDKLDAWPRDLLPYISRVML